LRGKAEQKITRETAHFAMAVEQVGACSRRLKTLMEFFVDLLHQPEVVMLGRSHLIDVVIYTFPTKHLHILRKG
jgi:small-conductance mechanosensitive channel